MKCLHVFLLKQKELHLEHATRQVDKEAIGLTRVVTVSLLNGYASRRHNIHNIMLTR